MFFFYPLIMINFLNSFSLISSELLNPEDQHVKANPQVWRHFNLGSEAVLHCMLCSWACVQRSTVGQCEKHVINEKKHQQVLQPSLPKFLLRVLSWCQAQPYNQELLSSVFANWYSHTANCLCSAKSANKASQVLLQYSFEIITSWLFALISLNGLDTLAISSFAKQLG